MLTYGVMSKEPMQVAGGQLLFKQITYTGFNLGDFIKMHTADGELERIWEFLVKRAGSGEFRFPDVDKEIPLSQIKEAVARAFEERQGDASLLLFLLLVVTAGGIESVCCARRRQC